MPRDFSADLKYLWCLRLIRQFRECQSEAFGALRNAQLKGKGSLDWLAIQSRLLPDVVFLMGTDLTHDPTDLPIVVFCPEFNWWTPTDQDSLEEAIRSAVIEIGDGDNDLRNLRSQVGALRNPNSKHKGERLLKQLEDLLA